MEKEESALKPRKIITWEELDAIDEEDGSKLEINPMKKTC
jgi:hypothetical protein